LFVSVYIHGVNLKGIDLNLVVALDALLRTSSVTRAASELGLSQPAVSNALSRLRNALGDPLFVRHGKRLVPTPAALAMQPALRRALGELERAIFPKRSFDPSSARAVLRLAVSDYWQFALLPSLVEWLERHAPGVRLDATPVGERTLAEDLSAGRVDAAIYLNPFAAPGLHAEPLFSDGYVCAVRRGHPLARKRAALADFARYRQVVVTPRGPWSETLDRALQAEGLDPHVALATPHFQVALAIVARTDCATVLPRRIAEQQRVARKLQLLRPPIELGEFSLAVFSHERTSGYPLHDWFRALLSRMARQSYLGTDAARVQNP
jgi:DNA-binding transcriptional LysR family regulator